MGYRRTRSLLMLWCVVLLVLGTVYVAVPVRAAGTMRKTPKIKVKSTETTIKFSWSKVKGAKGYTVQKKTGGRFQKLTDTKKTSYTDKKVFADEKYTYRVRAYAKKNGKKVFSPWKITVASVKNSAVKLYSASAFEEKVNGKNEQIRKIRAHKTELRKADKLVKGESYTGTAYYLSESGDDNNDGLSENTPWRTIARLQKASLSYGDAVFFHRGDTFRGMVICVPGVAYAAYGDGEKPFITGSPENAADPSKWKLSGKTADGGSIWEYYKDITDCGNLYFDDLPVVDHKVAPNRRDGKFIDDSGSEFDVTRGLTSDLSFISYADSKLPADMNGFVDVGGSILDSKGKLYLRCDKGNPGDVFSKIEFGTSENGNSGIFNINGNGKDVSVLDLHIQYGCSCGLMLVSAGDCLIRGCEVACFGGYVLNYKDGVPERCGGGICASGINCTIDTNYIHDSWDEGITVECGYQGVHTEISDYRISGNVIERQAISGIQFVAFEQDFDNPVVFKNIEVDHNYIYGSPDAWGFPVRGGDYGNGTLFGAECIRSGQFGDPLASDNFTVHDNVFYSISGSPVTGSPLGKPVSLFRNNTFLVDNRSNAVAVYRITGTETDWYRLNGRDGDAVKLMNEIIGKNNSFIVKVEN